MPVDASIYNLSRAATVADPAQQYLTVAKLAQLQREGQVGDLQLAKLQQEMADDEAVKAFYKGVKPGESPRGRLSELMSVSPKAGMQAQKFYQEADKSQADLMKTDRENMVALLEESRKRLPLIRDDATLAQYRDEAIQRAGMFVTPQFRDIAMRAAQNVPTRFDPAWVQAQVLKAEDLMVPKMEKVDIGGTIQMVDMNPLTNPAIRGMNVTKTMTPGEKDTSARGWASNAETRRHNTETERLTSERDRQAGRTYDAERGVVVNTRENTAAPVIQGGAPLGPKTPEFAKKELASIDSSRNLVKSAIEAAATTPSAFGMKRGLATMAGAIPESAVGRWDSAEERQARAFIFNNVSAVINERAGAAQSAQELARLRAFLPAETDDAEQIVDKMTAFDKYLNEKRSAYAGVGPSQSKPAESKPASTGMGTEAKPFVIRGEDGFGALPKGAYFKGPDGVLRRKP